MRPIPERRARPEHEPKAGRGGVKHTVRCLAALVVLAVPSGVGLLAAAPVHADAAASISPSALPAVQQAKLADPGATNTDGFAYQVAISGDTAVVPAELANVGGKQQAGIVYVFVRSHSGWSLQAKLTGADASEGDQFGSSVALSGDTALVGMSGVEAYVFTRSGTSWSQQAILHPPEGQTDAFGSPVALEGDTALIGGQGAVYVFTRSGTSWSQQAKLTASDEAPNDGFGGALALSGDSALVAAATSRVGGTYDQGAAYVFTRSGTSWSQQAKLTVSDRAVQDLFGAALALSGDTALVGNSPLGDHQMASAGEADRPREDGLRLRRPGGPLGRYRPGGGT